MQQNLTIYFTSDVHGYFSPVNYATGEVGSTGLANCISAFQKDENTLVIDGGDILQGSPLTYYLYSQCREGECVPARLMNIAGYDYITLGNHDFNYGKTELERYLREINAVCLCANVSGIAGVEKTALVTLPNGLKVGLTGVTTPFVTRWEKKENMVGIEVTDAFAAAASALDELCDKGADITVCIYHGGFENDIATGAPISATGENQGWRICNELGYDLLLTGHQHMPAENLSIGGTFACQPPDKARQYVRVDAQLEVKDGARRFTAQSALCTPSAEPLDKAWEYLAPIEEKTAKWLDTPVGRLDTPLLPDEPLKMAENGSLIANFFNQVQLEASGAQLSATSLDSSVKGFSQNVTVRDVVSSYVFPNTLKTVFITRDKLKLALERSAEYYVLDGAGALCVSEAFLRPVPQHFNFDYVSGVDVTVDVRRAVGDRVVSIKYNGQELDPDTKLTICLNSFRAGGAGGYGVYAECESAGEVPTEIAELIIDYLARHGDIVVDKTKWMNIIY